MKLTNFEMIELYEQFGYGDKKTVGGIDSNLELLATESYKKTFTRKKEDGLCFSISYKSESEAYHCLTTYYVGVDWVIENQLPIYIQPKQDTETTEVDFLKMLFDALKEPENFNHLDDLYEVHFEKPTIEIEQNQDLLTPLLLVQFIHILKKIVQKGLKKSYYPVTKNLNAKVKGKILVNETIKKNHFNNKKLYNYCQYTEFGINSIENKILKKTLDFSVAAMQNLKGIELSPLKGLINYIQPAFSNVDNDVHIEELKSIKPNKLYKEYEQALRLAKQILKRYGYNISKVNAKKQQTPPFWIDMSKLFELYVFSKLRERFKGNDEVIYHERIKGLELDFLINTNECKMVVDAKYKPQYKDKNINIEDIRQISGYARLSEVYRILGIDHKKSIDCLVIFSDLVSESKDFVEQFKYSEQSGYTRFYKIGIKLPLINEDL